MTKYSYDKSKIKVLLLEGVHRGAVEQFKEEGYQVEYLTTALSEEELVQKIKGINLLGIRSKTQVTSRVIESADRLHAIGTFCIGVNQVDLDSASKKGIAVFNAPYSNTRSVVELAIAEMILLIRNLPDKIRNLHNGVWAKSSNNSYEIRGKKLGIIGYGSIGSQLSVVAESIGLDVYYFDLDEKLPLGNATKCNSLEDLLTCVDIVSVHIDGREENNLFIGSKELEMLKDGAVFLNLARGKVVDTQALRSAIDSGKILGAGIDVFPYEPKNNQEPFESELCNARNTILTPHIGGSTEEAQEHIGQFVPQKLINYINTGATNGSVNIPNVQLPSFKNNHRFLHIHRNVPSILANINQLLAKKNINVEAQFLKTNELTGYVIVDIDTNYDQSIIHDLRSIPGTLKFRVLY